jgi:hypothetical protein
MPINSNVKTVQRWRELDRIFARVAPEGSITRLTILERLPENCKVDKNTITCDIKDLIELGQEIEVLDVRDDYSGRPKKSYRYAKGTKPLFACNVRED